MRKNRNKWRRTSSIRTLVFLILVVAASGAGIRLSDVLAAGYPERVSVATDGSLGNSYTNTDDGNIPSISGDGRYVAFTSNSSNLVSGDTGGFDDIFVRDRQAGTTERVSVAPDGSQGNKDSYFPSISADGRYVAFMSYASNLVSGDTNGFSDIFVHDRQAGTTERVSVASDGSQANYASSSLTISADGRYVAFQSGASNLVPGDTNGFGDILVRDRQAGTTERVSVATDGSQENQGSTGGASISADGRYVAFVSYASNLVSGDTNGFYDIFVRDRQTGMTKRVNLAYDGSQANGQSVPDDFPSISADGQYIAFNTYATNLVVGGSLGKNIFVTINQPPDTTPPNITPNVTCDNPGNTPWCKAAIAVSWTVTDGESPITSTSGCDTTTISSDTPSTGTTLTCTGTSAGGTASNSVMVFRDGTPPSLAPVVSPNPVLLNGSATASPNTTDSPSGVASSSCSAVDTSTVGSKTVTCTATDNAGNIASTIVPYSVIYNFSGFFQPVDNLPVLNRVNGTGRNINVKFSLAGNQGLDIFAPGYPTSRVIACDTGAPVDDIEETTAAGPSGLQYDSSANQYIYSWSTSKSWSGTCRQLTIRLNDGTDHKANFQFK